MQYRNRDCVNKRVGILTWHYNNNFGSTLQAYALQESVKKVGYAPFFLNYRKKERRSEKYKNIARLLRSYFLEITKNEKSEELRYGFLRFQSKYYNEGKYAYDIADLKNQCKHCYAVICGSDQIWAPNVFDPIYFLNFVPKGVKKISYAASIGLPIIPDDLIPRYVTLLKDFDAVSVREEMGRQLLDQQCGIAAECVLDPTLLLDKNDWKKLERGKTVPNYGYIFCYFLKKNNDYNIFVREYKKRLKMKVICISVDNKNADEADIFLSCIGPDDFLALLHNARMVITDSFHGTAFSINYGVDFATLPRFSERDRLCQNSRIHNILDITGLNKHLISSIDDIYQCDIKEDFSACQEILKIERIKSMNYLAETLG